MADLPKPALAGRPYANYFSVLRELTNTGDNILKYLRSNLLNLLDGALMPVSLISGAADHVEAPDRPFC